MVEAVASLGISLFESACVVVLYDGFIPRKSHRKALNSILMVLILTGTSFLVSFFVHNTTSIRDVLIKYIFHVLASIFVVHCFFRSNWSKTIVLSSAVFFIVYAVDFICLAVTDQITGHANTYFNASVPTRLFYSVIYKAFLFFIIMIIRLIYQLSRHSVSAKVKRKGLSDPKWILCIAMPILCILSVTVMFSLTDYSVHSNPWFIAIMSGWLFLNLFIFILVQIMDAKETLYRTNQLVDQQIETILEGLKTVSLLNKNYHDYQNDLICIRDYLIKGNSSAAKEYITKLPYSGSIVTPRLKTHNEVVDAIVNQKYWTAKSNSICIMPMLCDLSNIPIEDRDLVAIISNLLDNAIEACYSVDENKVVQLKMFRNENELVISVKNPVAQPVVIKDGVIESSKKDKALHGFGLYSIQQALDKYGAINAYFCDDSHFMYSAVIPLNSQVQH